MAGTIEFAGIGSESLGVRIGSINVYGAPIRDRQAVTVPGRLGEYLDEDAPEIIGNEIRRYNAAVFMPPDSDKAQLASRMEEIRAWLMAPKGYQRLTDSYEPDYYREAVLAEDLSTTRIGAGENMEFPLVFSCRPQRFLRSWEGRAYFVGRKELTRPPTDGGIDPGVIEIVTEKATAVNPSKMIAWPKIAVESEATITLRFFDKAAEDSARGTIKMAATGGAKVILDTESTEAWYDSNPESDANSLVLSISGDVSLHAGTTIIKTDTTTGNNGVDIYPRFWVR